MSLEDIYKRYDVKATISWNGKNPKGIISRLDPIQKSIIEHMENNKWDQAYIQCKKWILCVEWLKKQKLEKDSSQESYSLKKQNHVKRLFREIKLKIEGDYLTKQQKLQNSTNPGLKNNKSKTSDETDIELQLPDVPTDEPQPKNPGEIFCSELYSIMHNAEKREQGVLIIDLREADDFAAGKMAFQDYMINIPASQIESKKTAKHYETILMDNDAAMKRFKMRGRAHLIVLFDWAIDRNRINSPINIFKKTLERDKTVSNSRIAILQGGFDEWIRDYPKLIVRPESKKPEVTKHIPDTLQNEIRNQIDNNFGFDYPPSPNPSINSISPASSTRLSGVKALPSSSTIPQVVSNNSINAAGFSDLSNFEEISQIPSYVSATNQMENNAMNMYNNTSMYSSMSGLPLLSPSLHNQLIIPNSTINPSALFNDVSNYNESPPAPYLASTSTPVANSGFYPTLNGVPRMREPKVVLEKLPPPKPTVDRSSKPVPGRKISSDNSQIERIEMELSNARLIIAPYEKQIERGVFLDDWSKEQYATFKKKEEELLKELDKAKNQGPSAPKSGKLYPDLTNNLSGLVLNSKPRTTRLVKPDIRNEDKENIQQPQVMLERMIIDPSTSIASRTPPQKPTTPIQRMEVDEPPAEIYREPLRTEPTTPSASGMKRSLSSPNLQKVKKHKAQHQFLPNEAGPKIIPQVDRSSKPQSQENNARMPVLSSKGREDRLEPVYGNNTHPGITGLKNLGNSCYMNSIIQCLSNTGLLAKYFNDNRWSSDLNKKNDKRATGYVAEEVAQVIKALWRGQYKSISPRDLKNVIGKYRLQFENTEQQDSHEFLVYLLDWMHDDLKKRDKMSYNRELSVAEKEWEKSLEGQTSIISQLFWGQLRSTIECTTCMQKSTTYETFNSLTMSLPSQNKCTLDDCVKKFVTGQKVSGWKCPNCKVPRDVLKKFDFIKLPLTIIIHLNRFGDTGGWIEKKNTAVDFPLTGLDLQPYVVSDAENNSPSSVYNLYAMSNHYGTMDGGHYTAYCKSSEQRKWYKYDDHTVSEVPQSQVKSQSTNAYLLFYASVPAEKMIMHS